MHQHVFVNLQTPSDTEARKRLIPYKKDITPTLPMLRTESEQLDCR